MPSADSIIRVSIIGDAKKLIGAVKDTDKATGGLLKKAGGALLGLAAVDKAFDFVQGAVQESDRLGDAMTRLNISIGEADTAKLSDVAENFSAIGASKQDILELGANFADTATALGVAAPDIADLADNVAATATAMSLLDDSDAAGNVDLITKAAGGSEKAMRALGISIDETEVEARALRDTGKSTAAELTDGEKSTARLNIVLDALKPKLDAATEGTGDLEQHQKSLQAQVETLSAKLGGPLSEALDGVLGFILDEIDAFPGAIEGWKMLGRGVEDFARFAMTPLGNVAQAFRDLLGLTQKINAELGGNRTFQVSPGRAPRNSAISDSSVTRSIQRTSERTGGLGRSQGGP